MATKKGSTKTKGVDPGPESENLQAAELKGSTAVPTAQTAALVIQSTKDQLKADIERFRTRAAEAVATAKSLVIDSTEAEQKAADVRAKIKKDGQELEALRLLLGEPFRKLVDSINAEVKITSTDYVNAENQIKGKVVAWREAEQKRINAENERLRKEQEERQKQALLESIEKGTPAPEIEQEAPPQFEPQAPTTVVGAEGGKFSTRKTWTFKITDSTLIPRQYLMVNEKMIKAAISSGSRNPEIPGVDIFQETNII